MNNYVWVANQFSGTLVAYQTNGTQTSISQGASFPSSVAVAEDGHVFVTQLLTNQILGVNANGTTATSFAVGSAPSALCLDGNGDLWVTDSNAASFYKVQTNGTVLLTVTPGVTTLNFTGGVAANAFNQVWVANANDNNVYICDTNGSAASFSPITTGATQPTGVAVDRSGDCWVTYQSGAIYKFNHTTGAVLASITTGNSNPVGIAVNNFNEIIVANADASGTVNHYGQTGVFIQSTTLGESAFGVALDGNGDVWVTGTVNHRVYKLDRFKLNQLGWFSTGTLPLNLGDFTGYVHANIFNQGAQDDLDGDGDSNANEVDAGTNPFDANSTVTNPRPVQTGEAQIGTSCYTAFRCYNDALLGFAAAASFNASQNPSNYISVPFTNWTIPLEHDGLYDYSFQNFWVFQNYGGFLDQDGDAYGQIYLPSSFTALVGTKFYIAFVTLDNSRLIPIKTISNNLEITIQAAPQ
jgi:streptogramin lyase